MAELKTKETAASVKGYLDQITDEGRRKDCKAILKLMKEATGAKPKIWGEGIVGFGNYHYKYPSGREGDWFLAGFGSRKQNITVYVMPGFPEHESLLKKLGKFKAGKGCLYIKRLEDIDTETLKELVKLSAENTAKLYA